MPSPPITSRRPAACPPGHRRARGRGGGRGAPVGLADHGAAASGHSSGRLRPMSGRRTRSRVNSCTAALHLSLLAAGVGPGRRGRHHAADLLRDRQRHPPRRRHARLRRRRPRDVNLDAGGGRRGRHAAHARAAAGAPRRPPRGHRWRLRASPARHGLRLIEDAAHCVEGVSDGRQGRRDRRLRRLQLLRHQEPEHGRGRHGDHGVGRSGPRRMRVGALHGMSRDAWARYGHGGSAHYDVVVAGLQVQHDGPPGGARPGAARAAATSCRRAALGALGASTTRGWPTSPLGRPAPCPPGQCTRGISTRCSSTPTQCGWTRDELRRALAEEGIGTSVHFRAVHLFTYYAATIRLRAGHVPHAEHLSDCTLSLPLSGSMRDDDAARVVDALRRLLACGPRRR